MASSARTRFPVGVLSLLTAAAAAAAPRAVFDDVHVCCDGTDAPGCAAPKDAVVVASLDAALAHVRSARAAGELRDDSDAFVLVSGRCAPPRPLTAADSNLHFRTAPYAQAPASISGGVPVYASNFTSVSDPAILAQIQPAARPYVQVLDVATLAGGVLGSWQCRPYMGGEASILPGNLVSSALELFVYGDPTIGGDASPLTLARYPNVQAIPNDWLRSATVNGQTMQVPFADNATLARLPLWAQQLSEDVGSVYAHYVNDLGWADHHNMVQSVVPPPLCDSGCGGDTGYDYNGNDLAYGTPIMTGSFNACCAACSARPDCSFFSWCTPPGSCGNVDCYLKSSDAGRDPNVNRVSGHSNATVPASASITLAPCPSHYAEPGYDTLTPNGHLYVYNLLSELDQPGEYYLNLTSGLLYVWLPSPSDAIWTTSAWGSPVMPQERAVPAGDITRLSAAARLRDTALGYISVNETLLDISGASNVTFTDMVIQFGRGVGVVGVDAVNVTFSNVLVQNVGNMAVNITNGSGVLLTGCTVRHAGNGAVYMYAGDRIGLVPSGHTVSNSSISYCNRYMFCYVPSVAMGNCGNAVLDSELYGGPHQGTFMSGNLHTLADCLLHDLTQGASDSGAFYAGRDFTYQGNAIHRNTFERIISSNGPDVSAVYLDDQISGFSIINNTFVNVSRAYLLGGGRDNIFEGNVINGVTGNDAAVHVDNRGMGWAHATCSGDGEMIQFLSRVPYNTSPVWIAAFPHLAVILEDDPCVPKYNTIIGTQYCISPTGAPFLDQTNATLASWNMTEYDNTPTC